MLRAHAVVRPAVSMALILGACIAAHGAEVGTSPRPKKEPAPAAKPKDAAEKPGAATATVPAADAAKKKDAATLVYENTPISDVVRQLQHTTGLNIILDPELANSNATVTLRVENMRLEHALKWICQLVGADFVLEDEAIFIAPRNKLHRVPSMTMSIDVRDLVSPVASFPAPRLEFAMDPTDGRIEPVIVNDFLPPEVPCEPSLADLVERALHNAGQDVIVDQRDGQLIVTVAGTE